IGIKWSVGQTLTVAVAGIDEWRRSEVLREPLAQEKRGQESALCAPERRISVESIQGATAAPAGIECLRVKNSIPSANYRLWTQRIRDAQARSKSFIPSILRMSAAKAGISPPRPRER